VDFRSILAVKRDGGTLSEEEIRWFMTRYVAGELEDHHAAALLACIYLRGMQPGELVAWTRAMLESGTRLAFPELGQRKADKHSTGGVGDKVSIPLAPAVAACGVAVPMISGRGLGHTGGTLDKLESIPGMRVELSEAEIHGVIGRTGLAFGAQTDQLVPADKLLYRLRDATGLVASIPLIASSILSKKLAEGLDALVLDVKYGSGARSGTRSRSPRAWSACAAPAPRTCASSCACRAGRCCA
jgi:thymidine phosphorylase